MFPREKPQLDPIFANHRWKFLNEKTIQKSSSGRKLNNNNNDNKSNNQTDKIYKDGGYKPVRALRPDEVLSVP